MRFHHIILTILICYSCVACNSLPDLGQREASYAIPSTQTQDTQLGKVITSILKSSKHGTGIVPLAEAEQALETRLMLIENAEASLDMQYYIWSNDGSGRQMFEAIHRAADRGVKVRFLLDDLHSRDIEKALQKLNAHPKIEIRLFNPFLPRSSRILGFITDFSRANRRMHNKSFTVDNQVTIIGGRNIGDNYFNRSDGVLFVDLDVLAIGNVVGDVSNDFDAFWNSASAYPYELLSSFPTSPEESNFEEPFTTEKKTSANTLFSINSVIWAKTEIVSDNPLKALGKAESNQLITHSLRKVIGQPKRKLIIVSPYFIPTLAGVQALEKITQKGVEVSVLTNAFATTDVAVVHSGYAKWRKRLLKAGVQLFEMRPATVNTNTSIYESVESNFSSSVSSLHAKTFVVDGRRVFVGSFNFDPRSANLNTELGFIIESPELAKRMEEVFYEKVPYHSFEVHLSSSGSLYWIEKNGDNIRRYNTEPGTTWFGRFSVGFFSFLPIDWLL